MKKQPIITRRTFVKRTAGTVLAFGIGVAMLQNAGAANYTGCGPTPQSSCVTDTTSQAGCPADMKSDKFPCMIITGPADQAAYDSCTAKPGGPRDNGKGWDFPKGRKIADGKWCVQQA